MSSIKEAILTACCALVSYIAGLNWALLLIWFIMMMMDVITGNIKHKQLQTWKSADMRGGLLKKSQEFFLLFSFILAQFILEQMGYEIPIAQGFAGLFAFKELGSIYENCRISGVDIPLPIKKWFFDATGKVLGTNSNDDGRDG